MGWEALEQWGDGVARIEPLAGGVANDVWSVRMEGHLAVARLGARSDADLAWEAERAFDALAEGGEVGAPFGATFWSKGFGMCTDRFGVPWMVDTAGEPEG